MSEWALVVRMCTRAWGAVVCVQHFWWAYGGRLQPLPAYPARLHLKSDLPTSVPSGSSRGSEIRHSSASSSGTGSKLQEKGSVGDWQMPPSQHYKQRYMPAHHSPAQPSPAVHAEPARAFHAPNCTLASTPAANNRQQELIARAAGNHSHLRAPGMTVRLRAMLSSCRLAPSMLCRTGTRARTALLPGALPGAMPAPARASTSCCISRAAELVVGEPSCAGEGGSTGWE